MFLITTCMICNVPFVYSNAGIVTYYYGSAKAESQYVVLQICRYRYGLTRTSITPRITDCLKHYKTSEEYPGSSRFAKEFPSKGLVKDRQGVVNVSLRFFVDGPVLTMGHSDCSSRIDDGSQWLFITYWRWVTVTVHHVLTMGHSDCSSRIDDGSQWLFITDGPVLTTGHSDCSSRMAPYWRWVTVTVHHGWPRIDDGSQWLFITDGPVLTTGHSDCSSRIDDGSQWLFITYWRWVTVTVPINTAN